MIRESHPHRPAPFHRSLRHHNLRRPRLRTHQPPRHRCGRHHLRHRRSTPGHRPRTPHGSHRCISRRSSSRPSAPPTSSPPTTPNYKVTEANLLVLCNVGIRAETTDEGLLVSARCQPALHPRRSRSNQPPVPEARPSSPSQRTLEVYQSPQTEPLKIIVAIEGTTEKQRQPHRPRSHLHAGAYPVREPARKISRIPSSGLEDAVPVHSPPTECQPLRKIPAPSNAPFSNSAAKPSASPARTTTSPRKSSTASPGNPEAVQPGLELGIVVGGGNFWRGASAIRPRHGPRHRRLRRHARHRHERPGARRRACTPSASPASCSPPSK